MRKVTIILLISIFLIICSFLLRKDDTYEVLKVVSSTDFFVDLNRNKVAEENERIQLFELDTEPDELSRNDIMRLNYLARTYANQKLLNKVKVISIVNENVKIILSDGTDYSKSLIENGYIITNDNKDAVLKNLEYAKTLNLVSYNIHSKKFHKLGCKYALNSVNEVLMKESDTPKDASPCKFCHLKKSQKSNINRFNKYPRVVYEPYSPVYKDKWLEFYVTDFTKYFYPSDKCLSTPCKSLLKEINAAKSSIDFAIYGIDKQPLIFDALINAQKRGVKIRWIYDVKKDGNTLYLDTLSLKKQLVSGKNDTECSLKVLPSGKQMKDAIMHNKFFIFDHQKVWTGSANITHTDLSGFNANSAVLINSSAVAQIYENEFEQMYKGYFHQLKSSNVSDNVVLGPSIVSIYFSPQDKIIEKHIIPLINESKKYIYIPVFVITHKNFNQALINAKKRGVDVRVIVDATSAGSKYSSVKNLRENGLKVKTENRAGKMHMKSIIIDDEYSIIGSMNFTKSGEDYNDENVLIIKNPKLAIAFKDKFLYLYNTIPEKWLHKNPGAESWNSINSCFDGIDNDFDGKIDKLDEGCFSRYRG